jgi:hypothetical protein
MFPFTIRSPYMRTNDILTTLRGERDRIDRAIEILEGIAGNHKSNGSAGRPGRRKREKLSAAAKRRISAGMRASWAARKKKKIHLAAN